MVGQDVFLVCAKFTKGAFVREVGVAMVHHHVSSKVRDLVRAIGTLPASEGFFGGMGEKMAPKVCQEV